MTDKPFNITDHINKKDMELILEVNRKAIEIETEMVNQNEEIIDLLDAHKKNQEDITTKINDFIEENDKISKDLTKKIEEINKDLFKIQVLFLTGIISLVMQIIQIFSKKP